MVNANRALARLSTRVSTRLSLASEGGGRRARERAGASRQISQSATRRPIWAGPARAQTRDHAKTKCRLESGSSVNQHESERPLASAPDRHSRDKWWQWEWNDERWPDRSADCARTSRRRLGEHLALTSGRRVRARARPTRLLGSRLSALGAPLGAPSMGRASGKCATSSSHQSGPAGATRTRRESSSARAGRLRAQDEPTDRLAG